MCDKNYTCRKNPHNKPHVESSFSNGDSSTSVNAKIPKQKTKNTIELYSSNDKLENETFVCEPCLKNISHPHSCYFKSRGVTFTNSDSTSKFAPSFNLQSIQKSTPKRQPNHFQMLNNCQTFMSPPPAPFQTAETATLTRTAQIPLQTTVTIEREPNNQMQNPDDIETIV